METQYNKFKQLTLKDLSESHGRTASNRPRRELIVELMEIDRTTTMAEPIIPNAEEDEILPSVRLRLTMYGPNPHTEGNTSYAWHRYSNP
ncbi:Hypothetical predicted protein [Pelobates cultripes]|uniref:Uncharacterized protein n=1 Tax=Pelobates cultripes TaxID=61616 RepID=A0AAD1TEF3_PELCU|nr:Hypothetical predicted protein [Pelobates cultripes]